MDPEKTTPGMAVSAADCAGLQPGVVQGSGEQFTALGRFHQQRRPSKMVRSVVRSD
jgi:hypothetical protein